MLKIKSHNFNLFKQIMFTMNIKFLLTIIALIFYSQFVSAQNRQINGTVTSSDSLKALLGTTVNVKGTNIRTSTNNTGKYTLNVPQYATTLIFSFVGMKTVEEKIEGRSTINVTLADDVIEFETVIITALGLKEERDKIASSISTIKGNSIVQSGETGLLNGLSGKVAGILVTRNGGDPGAGSYIQIR